ncbi:CU044_5270 family protein [Actinoallomurus sp. CA-150999]|uniref:CU044_5270 family protein n=1 Tax=Actinoallomurus sp. CA-150999 TaxID=3239887 RepID=UPI003D89E0B1
MDELQAVRELLPEAPPPKARVVAQARLRATGAGRRRAPRLRWTLPGLGLVAAATAVALALGTTGGAPKRSIPTPLPLGGKAVFLAAAERAESQPMGGYWYSDQISGASYLLKDGYAIIGAHLETFEWTGAAKSSGGRFYGRDLPARPATPEDEAAWRRAGAPRSFRVLSNGSPMTYTRHASRWEEDKGGRRPGGRFPLRGGELTTQEVLRLPTDPETLASRFLTPLVGKRPPGASGSPVPKGPAPVSNAYKLELAASLFEGAPLPPKVRAGLMRALVAQPGVHTIETATDALGRQGVALAVDQPSAGWQPNPDGHLVRKENAYREQVQLIFDKGTGALLADQTVLLTPGGQYRSRKPGFVIDYLLTRSSGWTDHKPSPPSALPFK